MGGIKVELRNRFAKKLTEVVKLSKTFSQVQVIPTERGEREREREREREKERKKRVNLDYSRL